jgi:hypothetical protein
MRKKPSSSSTSSSPSSYATAAKPKRSYKKKRRVTPSEPTVAPAPIASLAAESYKAPITSPADSTKLRSTTADATSKVTTELTIPSVVAKEDILAHLLQPTEKKIHGCISLLPRGSNYGLKWSIQTEQVRVPAEALEESGRDAPVAWALEESGVTTEEDVPVLLGIQRGRWVSSLYTKVSHYRDLTTEGDQTNTN